MKYISGSYYKRKEAEIVKVLDISALYYDSATALVSEQKIIATAQEERFTRKKHDL